MYNILSVACSGCGKHFISVNPVKYYQFCSGECRKIIEDWSDEFIDERHAAKLISDPIWVVAKLKSINHE